MGLYSSSRTAGFLPFLNISTLLLLLLSLTVIQSANNGLSEYRATYRISENAPSGMKIGTVAMDSYLAGSSSQFSSQPEFRYILSKPSPYFRLNRKTSDLVASVVLDCEALCQYSSECSGGTANITLLVNVWRVKQLRALIRIHVLVQDLNDNPAKFEETVFVKTLMEVIYNRGKRIPLPRAVDIDIDRKHREIKYELVPATAEDAAAFSLSVVKDDRPYLVLERDLDYEARRTYNMVLKAWNPDQSAEAAQLKVKIKVANMNDNEPSFDKSVYQIKLAENTPVDSIFMKLNATDLDASSDTDLIYSLGAGANSDASRTFAVESDGRLRLIRALDFELLQRYTFPVQVSDSGFSAVTKVVVMVMDVNDEAPAFALNPDKLTVEENRSAGVLVGQLSVTDTDSPSVNGAVICREPDELQGLQPIRFSPDPISVPDAGKYDLYTRFQFDREEKGISGSKGGVVLSRLICNDEGTGIGGRRTSTLTATLTIADINDHSPRFLQTTYTAEIIENNEIGDPVIQVNASDLDEGENARLTYFLQDTANFDINEKTGLLSAARRFNRESEENSFKLHVLAKDNGSPQQTASTLVNVIIGDANDHVPEMRGPTDFEVFENSPRGQALGTLIAEDLDLGANGRLIFTLLPSKWSPMFTLYENGSLFTAATFDREVMSEYRFRVRVSDLNVVRALSITVPITVKIKDINDNAPVFDRLMIDDPVSKGSQASTNLSGSGVARISVHEAPGYPVLTVHATDRDEGINQRIRYRLVDQSLGGLLMIEETTGQLQLVRGMTRGHMGKHTLVVMAEDQGKPSLSSKKVLTILIEDSPARGDPFADRGVFANGGQGGRNIMIVIILSSVSAFLATVLITAILCMVRPCSSLSMRSGGAGRHHSQGRNIGMDPFLQPVGTLNSQHPHHQLYDLHGMNGLLYDKKPGGGGGVGSLPPGMGESLLSGIDTTGFLPGQFHRVGCQAGQDQNWTLPSPRRLSGSLCVDSNRSEGGGGCSPESERRDHTGTLPHKPLRGGKKADQVRMWAYESSCGKCGTVGGRGFSNQGNGGGGINGIGGNEEQSDSGRGGSDEDLCHHGVHTQYGIPIGQNMQALQARNCLMQTFQAPSSPSLAQARNTVNSAGDGAITTLPRGAGVGSMSSLSRFPAVSTPPVGPLPPPPPSVSMTTPVSSFSGDGNSLPRAPPPPQYTPSTRLPVTPFSATLSIISPRPMAPIPASRLPPITTSTANTLATDASLTTASGLINSSAAMANTATPSSISSFAAASSANSSTARGLPSLAGTRFTSTGRPTTTTSTSTSSVAAAGENRDVNPKMICDEIDQLFFKDMM